ncbi:DNA/RNA polymerases superfamily protein [Gossypium australe]|uniref:DNA/RNA polymerases superfamily protein n=1 Tax=Gossypium australe TaxID=47621 RepID=A0A5B6VA70_9ROSI|nr:DNA/RNA polymerases superfamily protein [Gossypium australe]
MDGQCERIIQILEDMLRCCILEFESTWEKHLPLIEFVYNKSFQSSIKMAPYEELYETEQKVKVIRDSLKVASDRQNVPVEENISIWPKRQAESKRSDPLHVIAPTEVEIQSDLSYSEEPI